jgi:hypothetical protein
VVGPPSHLGCWAGAGRRTSEHAGRELRPELLTAALELFAAEGTDVSLKAVEAWAVETPLAIAFEGFAPARLPADLAAGVISPHDEERIRLAAELHNAGRAEGVATP